MKYCKKCKRIHNDSDERCSVCGKELKTIVENNTPVYLLSASGFELTRVVAALEDSSIPSDIVSNKRNYSAEAYTGYDSSENNILVPYSAYEKAYDVCVGIGAIKEEGVEVISDDSENNNESAPDEQVEEMSGAKRTTIRIVSAIMFFLLVAIAVFGTDYIMKLLMGLF